MSVETKALEYAVDQAEQRAVEVCVLYMLQNDLIEVHSAPWLIGELKRKVRDERR